MSHITYSLQEFSRYNTNILYCPDKWGLIAGIEIQWKQLLYLDMDSFISHNKSLRGGVPIMFPNPWALKADTQYPLLKRHGFARDVQRQEVKNTDSSDTLTMYLTSSDITKQVYPYERRLESHTTINPDNSVTMTHVIHNQDTQDIPVLFGLHPYFRVPFMYKQNIERQCNGGDLISQEQKKRAEQSDTLYIESSNNQPMRIVLPTIGTLTLTVDPVYKRIRIRSESGKDFVCIEPCMWKPGDLDSKPYLLDQGASLTLTFTLSWD